MKTLNKVLPNKGVEKEYKKRLDKLVDAMSASVMYWILADFENRTPREMANAIHKRIKQWKKIFGDKADEMALWFVQKMKNHTLTGMKNAFKAADVKMKKGLSADVQKAVEIENSSLIKSIPEKYFTGVETVAMLALLYDWDKSELKDKLEYRYKVCKNRVKLIASDQTYKTTELFKQNICLNEGIKKGRWAYTWRSEKPRENHIRLDGALYDLEKGCYDFEEDEYIQPGQKINCYHKDTQVMTHKGFVKFSDLEIKDRILTLNLRTKKEAWAGINSIIITKSEYIVNISGKGVKMRVNPSHRFLCYVNKKPKFIVGIWNIKPDYEIYCGNNKYVKFGDMDIQFDTYNDLVYDIEVDRNNTLLIKDRGCVHWNGNCKCTFLPVIEDDTDRIDEEERLDEDFVVIRNDKRE